MIAKLHMVLVANPKVEAGNVRELIAYAKAHPNKLNYAGIGIGSAMHMGMELFKFMTKTEINHVSYRGTAPAITDVVSGVVDVMFTGPPSAKSMSEGGKLKLLAVAAPARMALTAGRADGERVRRRRATRWQAGSVCWRRRRCRSRCSTGWRPKSRRR